MFQLYSCKVRLGGSLLNEVPKEITAPEYFILKTLHAPAGGEDPIIDIKPLMKDLEHDDAQERIRLAELYGPALATFEDVKSINGVLGVATPLPTVIPGTGIVEKKKDELGLD
jgi:hypothetical protein